MKSRRFLLALFVAGICMSGSLHAIAAPVTSSDVTAEKKDSPPRPKPTPGPRDGGDE
ncbi:hypothetical protein IAD21_03327 [Abditibacteriota bacterium]|nr:hypothetical protein IAD21_03327 [Abditibacteriota bacterium]